MKTSQKGVSFIREFEGLETDAYQDVVGIWTIGVGHTGPEVKKGMTITESAALDILGKDLDKFEKGVAKLVKVPLSQDQFDALVSFSFNVGLGNFQSSTLLKLLNQGNYEAVPTQLLRWNKAGGKEVAGLTRRRAAEGQLWKGQR